MTAEEAKEKAHQILDAIRFMAEDSWHEQVTEFIMQVDRQGQIEALKRCRMYRYDRMDEEIARLEALK